ncbi:MAG: hypothetical protein ACRCYZ_04740, partial [Alphaproteobacteria bacterium]
MQKKMTSSLLITVYCFNSLPIFAAPLPDPMEETFKNLSKGVAAYGTPKEQKRFKRGRLLGSVKSGFFQERALFQPPPFVRNDYLENIPHAAENSSTQKPFMTSAPTQISSTAFLGNMTENSSTQKPFMTSAPTQISSTAPWGRVPEDFSTRSYGYGFLNDSSSNALTTTQAPYVTSNGNLGYYIGAGALAVGVAAAGIGAAIYHGWKAKKPKRNAAYDGVA